MLQIQSHSNGLGQLGSDATDALYDLIASFPSLPSLPKPVFDKLFDSIVTATQAVTSLNISLLQDQDAIKADAATFGFMPYLDQLSSVSQLFVPRSQAYQAKFLSYRNSKSDPVTAPDFYADSTTLLNSLALSMHYLENIRKTYGEGVGKVVVSIASVFGSAAEAIYKLEVLVYKIFKAALEFLKEFIPIAGKGLVAGFQVGTWLLKNAPYLVIGAAVLIGGSILMKRYRPAAD